VEEYSTCEDFLCAYRPRPEACLVLDLHFQDMGGLELLERLRRLKHALPTIVMSGSSQIPDAVQAMKSGAVDFIVKPVDEGSLLECVQRALGRSREGNAIDTIHGAAVDHLRSLTPRQRQIMDLVLAGQPSKNIAADLGISQRTVENHRAAIMHKTGSKSLAALARLAMIAVDVPVSPALFVGRLE
jgi:two-component system CheB/CheR fusion protein